MLKGKQSGRMKGKGKDGWKVRGRRVSMKKKEIMKEIYKGMKDNKGKRKK